MNTHALERCPTCHHIVSPREIALFAGMVRALFQVFQWCEKNGKHEFQRKEVNPLITDKNVFARFGDWIYFDLVYRPNGAKTWYGLEMARCEAFFRNQVRIPTRCVKYQSGNVLKEDYRYLREIPELSALLDEDQMFVARYRKPVPLSMFHGNSRTIT